MDLVVEETELPRYVRFRGKRVRVIGYDRKTENLPARFHVIDTSDNRRTVYRSQITFVKPRRKS